MTGYISLKKKPYYYYCVCTDDLYIKTYIYIYLSTSVYIKKVFYISGKLIYVSMYIYIYMDGYI